MPIGSKPHSTWSKWGKINGCKIAAVAVQIDMEIVQVHTAFCASALSRNMICEKSRPSTQWPRMTGHFLFTTVTFLN